VPLQWREGNLALWRKLRASRSEAIGSSTLEYPIRDTETDWNNLENLRTASLYLQITIPVGEETLNIYVGNLAYNVTEDDLRTLFSDFGEVSAVNIVKERSSGQSKGFGFVEMLNNSEADKAMKALNGTKVKDQFIKLSQAKPPAKRPQRNSRY